MVWIPIYKNDQKGFIQLSNKNINYGEFKTILNNDEKKYIKVLTFDKIYKYHKINKLRINLNDNTSKNYYIIKPDDIEKLETNVISSMELFITSNF